MGYRRMTVAILRNIYRRWESGQNLSEIERVEQVTRKTVRAYVQQFQNAEESDLSPENLDLFLDSIIRKSNLKSDSFEARILPYIDEIKDLIKDAEEPVNRKTAWLIVQEKYSLSGSYESFKLFTRKFNITQKTPPSTVRIETNPGEEIQIDYGKVGTLFDPLTERNRTVWCFAGKLSHSRHIYLEYVYSQDQESFVSSHVRMFSFLGGVPQYLTIDNLKSGVIKPDYYDPQINRAYQQMAKYYDTFINPCLPASPKQKGKIERSMPVVRELFRRLKSINPTYTLSQLNKAALKWSLEEYCKMDFFQDSCRRAVEKRIKTPKKLKELMEFDSHQMSLAFVQEVVSEKQKAMTRDIEYYMT